MAEIELRTTLKGKSIQWIDISSELFRQYDFGVLGITTIVCPQWLYVSPSGGHRIVDSKEVCHYIPTGWKHLYWQVKPGEPHFVR